MFSNVSEAFLQARADIAVPDPPIAAILRRLQESKPPRRRWKRSGTGMLFGAAAITACVAAATLVHTHVGLQGSRVTISAEHGSVIEHADQRALTAAVRHANFAVRLPSGLPSGSRLFQMVTGGKSLIAITYDLPGAWRRDDHLLMMLLMNPQAVGSSNVGNARRSVSPSERYRGQWRSGDEEVIVLSDKLTARELAAIKRAMHGR